MRCGIIRRMRRFRRLVPFRLGGVLRLRGPGITPSRRPVARLSRGIGVFIPALLWNEINVALLWGILIVVCLLSAGFIFAIMKKLEAATSDAPVPAEVKAEALETIEDDVI